MSTATNTAMADDTITLSKSYFKDAFGAHVEYLTDISLENFAFYKDNKTQSFKGHVCVVDGNQFPDNIVDITMIKARLVIIQNCQTVTIGRIDAGDILIGSCGQVTVAEIKTDTLCALTMNQLGIGEIHCDKFVGFINMGLIKKGMISDMAICATGLQYDCRVLDPQIYTHHFTLFGENTFNSEKLEFFMNTKSLSKLDRWLFNHDPEDAEYSIRNEVLTGFVFEYTICGDFPVQWLMDPGNIPHFTSLMDKYDYLTKTTESQRRKAIDAIKIEDGVFDFIGDIWGGVCETVGDITDTVGDFVFGARDTGEKKDPVVEEAKAILEEAFSDEEEEKVEDPDAPDTPWMDPNIMHVRPSGTYKERDITEADIKEMMDAGIIPPTATVQPQPQASTVDVDMDPMTADPASTPTFVPHIIGGTPAAAPMVGMGITPIMEDPMANEIMGDLRVKTSEESTAPTPNGKKKK